MLQDWVREAWRGCIYDAGKRRPPAYPGCFSKNPYYFCSLPLLLSSTFPSVLAVFPSVSAVFPCKTKAMGAERNGSRTFPGSDTPTDIMCPNLKRIGSQWKDDKYFTKNSVYARVRSKVYCQCQDFCQWFNIPKALFLHIFDSIANIWFSSIYKQNYLIWRNFIT